MIIEPTVGRIVHYRLSATTTLPAIITAVHDLRCVNLQVFGVQPSEQLQTSVRFVQPRDEDDVNTPYCEWDFGSESGEKG